ncbi:hypothetical protein Vafri_20192 [Volvox africanus]|uniref:Uncharacterized protein n=1 Tax=Volvox africanus TaxID=51714 RepID=A0A8J4BPM5_9CHLO|nr:hypothetical protein Vafri_20192 [Volvox africanus]
MTFPSPSPPSRSTPARRLVHMEPDLGRHHPRAGEELLQLRNPNLERNVTAVRHWVAGYTFLPATATRPLVPGGGSSNRGGTRLALQLRRRFAFLHLQERREAKNRAK